MSSDSGRTIAERFAGWGGADRRPGSAGGTKAQVQQWSPGWRRPTSAATRGTWDERVDHSPEGPRRYSVYTPAGLSPGTAVPLVVVLHGCNQSTMDAALGTRVNALADRVGFVALYPEQSSSDNSRRCWNWFDRRHQVRGSGEPAAIARITEQVLDSNPGARLDRNRVHVLGLSAGGAMAGILAATYPDVYASAGIHSAPQYRAARNIITGVLAMRKGGPNPERQGRLAHAAMGSRARVVPVIVFQGDADQRVWPVNGERVARQWLATTQLVSGQIPELDFASPHSRRADHTPGGLSASVCTWHDAAGRPVVEYWAVSGLGHAWSGGEATGSYTDPRGPDATEAMFEFFLRCPLDRDLPVTDPRPATAMSRAITAIGRRLRRPRRTRTAGA